MRRATAVLAALFIAAGAGAGFAQAPGKQPGQQPIRPGEEKKNPNPCRDEVSAALRKLRNSSWFRMETSMLTEKGPMKMDVAYVLPDRMHQKVTVQLSGEVTEIILVGDKAWSKQGKADWHPVHEEVTQQLRAQMHETVVEQQEDVGNYACKGRMTFANRDVFAYKLEDEGTKDSEAPRNEAFRMFYVDAITGMPVSNALVVPGRESKPLFEARYSFPIDLTIQPPKSAPVAKP